MKLLDQFRHVIRKKHYSIRTEQAYTDWVKLFHGKQHPKDMGEMGVSEFKQRRHGRQKPAGYGCSAAGIFHHG